MNTRISWGIYFDSALLFLSFLAHACSLPCVDKHLRTNESRGLAILPQHPASQVSYKGHHESFRPTDATMKRDDEQDDDLSIRRITIVTGSVPIGAAAHTLELFYNAILYNALAAWCNQPPQQVVVITMGRLQLTMTVVLDGGVPQGIPWAFVRNFARNMRAMTGLGFAGTYDMYYTRRDDDGPLLDPHVPNLGVEVRFRILWSM